MKRTVRGMRSRRRGEKGEKKKEEQELGGSEGEEGRGKGRWREVKTRKRGSRRNREIGEERK